MTFDSAKYFDRIRIKPRTRQTQPVQETKQACEWPGCTERGAHRAPKGRGQEREYWHFCTAHAREYNESYNFFAGMSLEDVARYQKDALTGHRPTWKMGANGGSKTGPDMDGAADPFAMFNEMNGRGRARSNAGRDNTKERAETRKVFNAERKALQVMGLEDGATLEMVKTRYKELVKLHHPDANGGDRSTEDRLIEVIQAYNYLKTVTRSGA